MTPLSSVTLALALTAAVQAQGTLQISIGVRETAQGGGLFSAIGANGGSAGGIEWVNRDAQVLTLDGTWQQFTFNLSTDPIMAFAGSTANGILEGAFGTLEHIRILNHTGITAPITLWIDDVTNTTQTGGAVVFGDFQGFTSGAEVMFQEPRFSGSTSANVMAGGTSGADNLVASRSASCKSAFTFVDNSPTRWLRLTTFNATNQPNPSVRFDDTSVISFWMRGGECQQNLGSQGPGNAIAEACGTGLGAGQSSVYYTSGATAFMPGAMGISVDLQPDLPIFGGNLVSGFGLVTTVTIGADATGRFALPLNPIGSRVDLVLQSVFFDATLPQQLAFTNAIRARFQ